MRSCSLGFRCPRAARARAVLVIRSARPHCMPLPLLHPAGFCVQRGSAARTTTARHGLGLCTARQPPWRPRQLTGTSVLREALKFCLTREATTANHFDFFSSGVLWRGPCMLILCGSALYRAGAGWHGNAVKKTAFRRACPNFERPLLRAICFFCGV